MSVFKLQYIEPHKQTDLIKRLKKYKQNNNFTLKQLEKLCNINICTLSNFLNYKPISIRIPNIKKLCKLLDLDLNYYIRNNWREKNDN